MNLLPVTFYIYFTIEALFSIPDTGKYDLWVCDIVIITAEHSPF